MLIVAHRGLHTTAPENSLGAVQAALAAGMAAMEVDVRAAGDGSLYLLHDARLDRTSDGIGRLRVLDAAAAARVRLADQTPLPTLDEVLALAAGRAILCIDVKEPDLGPAVLDAALHAGGAVEVWSTHREVVAAAADRGVMAALISHGVMPDGGVEALIDEANQLGAGAISFFPADVTPTVAHACAQRSMQFMSGTPNDRATWEQLTALGARALITDRPLECVAYAQAIGAAS